MSFSSTIEDCAGNDYECSASIYAGGSIPFADVLASEGWVRRSGEWYCPEHAQTWTDRYLRPTTEI